MSLFTPFRMRYFETRRPSYRLEGRSLRIFFLCGKTAILFVCTVGVARIWPYGENCVKRWESIISKLMGSQRILVRVSCSGSTQISTYLGVSCPKF